MKKVKTIVASGGMHTFHFQRQESNKRYAEEYNLLTAREYIHAQKQPFYFPLENKNIISSELHQVKRG